MRRLLSAAFHSLGGFVKLGQNTEFGQTIAFRQTKVKGSINCHNAKQGLQAVKWEDDEAGWNDSHNPGIITWASCFLTRRNEIPSIALIL